MSIWIFALVVLLFGLALAFLLDRMKTRPGSGPREPESRAERAKWLYMWFYGRFPTKEEERHDDALAERERERLQEERLEERRRERERRKGGEGE